MNKIGATLRYVGALAMTVLAGLSVSAARPGRISFPAVASAFTLQVAPASTALQIAVRSTHGEPSQLTIFLNDRQASFVHPAGSTRTYRLTVPASGGSRVMRIEADPQASVTLARHSAGGPPRRLSLTWQHIAPLLELPPPRSATPDRTTAEASVDETDTYGLRLFGVPVRTAPMVTAPLVTTVSHGDRLEAMCWASGDRLTNGFPERPLGAYSSDVWFRVATGSGSGFIPDVRFSRRGNSDRLNLPRCRDD